MVQQNRFFGTISDVRWKGKEIESSQSGGGSAKREPASPPIFTTQPLAVRLLRSLHFSAHEGYRLLLGDKSAKNSSPQHIHHPAHITPDLGLLVIAVVPALGI